MNTPAHILIGAAAFARPGAPAVTAAALFGSVAPDLSLYLMAGYALFVQDISPDIVFGQLYFSDHWQRIFAVDNSFIVWGTILALGIALKKQWIIAFAGAALLHLAFDFPLHHDDARIHFWPVSDWVFVSPVSYWDRDHYGGIVGPIEATLCLVLCVVLWRRFQSSVARLATVALGTFQVAPVLVWVFVFDG